MADGTTKLYDNVAVGDDLPGLEVRLGLTETMAAALATRDYQPVHHDPALAKSLGNKTVFINTHTTAGFLERVVSEWAGPDAFIKAVKFRMGTPHYADDLLTIRARVSARHEKAHVVTVDVVGTNSNGTHVDGTVTVQLP